MEKDVKALDINGDLRVERHEIKQAVKLASPDMEKDRKVYLDEIAKFKDMVKACDKITPDSSRGDGEIDFEEGQACLNENVSTSLILRTMGLKASRSCMICNTYR